MSEPTVRDLLAALRDDPSVREAWVGDSEVPPREARFAPADALPLAPSVTRALGGRGIERLWVHQAEGIAALRAGRHVVVSTPTASGKSLVYAVPILESVAEDPDGARALLVYPLKALARDQERALAALGAVAAPGFRIGVYDGDTPESVRRQLRARPPHALLTTPDMLHHGILPRHATWEAFLSRLRYVVLDEVHTYRGVFGSHVALILRRLLRVARRYGAAPRVAASSATVANPGPLLEALTGEPAVTVVSEDGSPHAGRVVLFLNPSFGAAPSTLAARVVRAACGLGLRTIAFTQARRMTELLFTWIGSAAPSLAPRLSAYRAGYRPEERREIEARLASGDLLGVISTSALEAGIDIGGLDVCVLVGYPGTVTATWQRAGRVGRAGRESLLVLVAGRDALDQYVVRHPAEVFGRGAEAAVCDPANPEVLKSHLPCAAAEIPLSAGEPLLEAARARGVLDALRKSGALLESEEGGRFLAARKLPHRDVDIREVGGSTTILRQGSDEPIGTLSSGRAFAEAHPGAIYLHRGETWRIERLDIASRLAYAAPADVPYYTEALGERDTEILETTRVRPLGNTVLRLGRLRVTTRVTGFQRRHVGTREVLGAEPLDLPPQSMETEGIWVEVPDRVVEHLRAMESHVMGAIHAAEHASIAVVPLFVLCDRGDVAGISFTTHPQVGRAVFFLYDGTPGGVGLSTRIFEVAEAVLGRARDAIRDCPCEAGCPACVQSPRCGNGNVPLDKRASVEALRALLGDIPLADLARGEAPMGTDGPREEPGASATPAPPARPPRVVVFDVETQRSAEEVGGWGNSHLMRVAVVCAWVLPEGEMREFREGEVGDLLRLLEGADLVVGFNCVRFDFAVLSAYTPKDLRKLPTLDILVEVEKALGHRLPLSHLARTTLGTEKSADGLQSLRWWKEGAVDKILSYCRKDVEITRDLYLHGLEKGYLLYDVRPDERVRVPVDFRRPLRDRTPSP